MFERFFGNPVRPASNPVGTLPVNIYEREGNLVVRAAIPGIDPNDLEVQIENNVLTVRGETRSDTENKDQKVYYREVTYGCFSRSVRLPEGLNLDAVDAEFKNGIVTITLPRVPEERPKALKISVRGTDSNAALQAEEPSKKS